MQILQQRKKRKGFTITELVIVIAVIAILASVMIVSYTSVLSSAKETAALEEARSEWTNLQLETIDGTVIIGKASTDGEGNDTSDYLTTDELSEGTFTIINSGYTDYVFQVVAGTFNADALTDEDGENVTYTNVTGDGDSDSDTYGTALDYEEANSNITVYYYLEAPEE